MGAPKPTLGYATRTEAVIALRNQGRTTQQIATRIGITPSAVTALEHSALKSAKRAKRPAETHGRTILFPVDVLNQLGPAATKRGIHVNSLVRLIVETVSDDNMVDALLDDGAFQ